MKTTFDVVEYVDAIDSEFRKYADPKRAVAAKAYVRDQFDYVGLPTPLRREIQKHFIAATGLPPFEFVHQIVKVLWKKPEREFQYFAMELYEKYKKQFTVADVPVFEFMITNKSWWETVDVVAPKLIAPLHLRYPELQEANCERWMNSGNMWLMRAALIHQLLYKKKTNEKLLYQLILQSKSHPDFFIRKAIGWTLRQYARTNEPSVVAFLERHGSKLSPLSLREASKHL